ncbi:MAG: ATP-dependent helicase HrpB [Planctomycetota bacterium]
MQLPIDAQLPDLVARAAQERALVLSADPGSGKTTRLPPALLDALEGEVWVLEPRRLAAKLAASFVGETLGERVGYRVRFERGTGPRTRLIYATEGILLRRLAQGDDLAGVGAVVLDEFHERHLETDLCLVLLERLRRTRRPDLALVIMSATLDASPLGDYLGVEPVHVEGRRFEVAVDYLPPGRRDQRLEDRVLEGARQLLDEGLDGHALVFLPGVAEIRASERALRPLAEREGLALYPLHGRLDVADTRRALGPSRARKLILCTNVAESSVTIDGVAAVLDAGLAKVPQVGALGLPTLELRPVSQAASIQRANRAGRQREGRCLRLFPRAEWGRRPKRSEPAILREELSGAALTLLAAGVHDPRWLDPPPPARWEAAQELLTRLGAVEAGALSAEGRRLVELPLPPRLGRVLLEGARRGVLPAAAESVALLAEPDVRQRAEPHEEGGPCDVSALRDLLREAGHDVGRQRRRGLRPAAVAQVRKVARALERAARDVRPEQGGADPELALRQALLAGHPDRVARRQRGRGLALVGGGAAQLAEESVVKSAAWLLALSARATPRGIRVELASAIEPDWLLEQFPDAIDEDEVVAFDDARERVEARWRVRFGALTLEDGPTEGDPEALAASLAAAATRKLQAIWDPDALEGLRRRVAFARELDPSLPALESTEGLVASLCQGCASFAELRAVNPLQALTAALGPQGYRILERLAPSHVTLAGGRRLEVHYEANQPPWVASRLQDFFGMAQGPTVGEGRVPLVLHLRAPNKQSVSVTSDLAGFWERHYPAARRELGRRYPRHSWPEDPIRAQAPRKGRAR